MRDNKYNANSHSGRFNKRITVMGPVIIKDDIGNESEAFSELRTLWSMVKTTKGSEFMAAAQNNTEHVTRFVVHYSKALDELFAEKKTRIEIRFKNVTYDVKSIINDDELNITFTIIAEGRL
ncbi:phage head closure protein [Paenibacillus sp. 11B]|uniref:phage head closure protein n=1 Tax=Bacillales TaxID=1385 RepID=UPI002652062E|nr:phage head closure protein [Paenibacillus sp. 11B]MDN8590932.1 phage head closure protein [Paenibacillus sp. 11B]